MINISENERRRAFSIWLRTGRLPSARGPDGIELKFNPWHDPETGRFTFVGAGRNYGQFGSGGFSGGGGGSATGSWDRPARPALAKSQSLARRGISHESTRTPSPSGRRVLEPAARRPATWAGGGSTGGGGGSFVGGGATAAETWGPPEPKRRPIPSRSSTPAVAPSNRAATNTVSARTANAPSEIVRTVVRNGYTYQMDARERTRHVSGMLTVAQAPVRSRTSQRQAGGAERRASDDGGHYIAARFNGPIEAFNHFAQNATLNRGSYRRLEDEWARDKRAGRAVAVKIVPQFGDNSVRPSTISVWWTVNGEKKSLQFRNEKSENRRGEN